ncbi:MAG: hypothetical protein M3Q71_23040 [Chloroflexota bacterium]|nr:hypothetical protein [Chloroflexota bacterium]
MASESDSETAPKTDDAEGNDNYRPVPPGWLDPGNGLLRLDPEHPSYPNSQKRHEKGSRKRLKTNPKIIAAIETLQEQFQPITADYLRVRRTYRDNGWERTEQATLRSLSNALPYISDELIAAAEACAGPDTAPVHVCRDYLLEQTLLPEIADRLTDPLEPVFLRANASPHAEYLIINPGEIVMRFTGATTRERGEALSGPITKLQAAWGYSHADTGGRPSWRDDPIAQEQRRTAAKLAYWADFTDQMVAEFFGWIDASTPQEKARHQVKKAGQYVSDGVTLLKEERGGHWRTPENVPPHMKKRREHVAEVRTKRERRTASR